MIKVDGVDVIDLLKWAGDERLNEVLPPPLKGKVRSHDAGCRPQIWAEDPVGKYPRILVWQDSRRHYPTFEFDDRDKILGLQPGCEWASDAIYEAFRKLIKMRQEEMERITELKKQLNEQEEARLRAAMIHYASILHDHQNRPLPLGDAK